MPALPEENPPFAAVVAHQVRDFETWMHGFNQYEDTRRALGALGHHINRTLDQPDIVRLYIPCRDRSSIDAFIASDEYQSIVREYGASDLDSLIWLKPLRSSIFRERQLPSVVIAQQVEDVDTWLNQYDCDNELRTAAGILGNVANQSIDDPSLLVIYYQADTFAELQAFVDAPEYIERMQQAGATRERTVTYQVGEFGTKYT